MALNFVQTVSAMSFVFTSGQESAIRRHCGLVQLAKAVVETTKNSHATKLDSLLAEEKGLLQCVGDDDAPDVVQQIIKNVQRQLELPKNERFAIILSFVLNCKLVHK